jgi:hypothetical protein
MLSLMALFGVVSLVSAIPKYMTQRKIKNENKKLEAILSKQGNTENTKTDGVENIYLNNSEFSKYFGKGNSAQGYVKQSSGKTIAKNFINLNSQICPILDYMQGMATYVNSGATLTEDDLKCFTIEKIKEGAKAYSAISNDSLTPGLIDSETEGKILSNYISLGIVEKRLLNPNSATSDANPSIYLLNPDSKELIKDGKLMLNKRYAVESGAIKFLGSLDRNYSSFENGKITIMPFDEKHKMKITNDENYNSSVLEKVLLNTNSLMLENGTLLQRSTENNAPKHGWEVLDSFVNQDIMLAPEQYINYNNQHKNYENLKKKEEEDKKKKTNQQALAQRNRVPVSA